MLLWYSTLVKACESETDINLQPNLTDITVIKEEINQT